ncbi:MAG TPA: hypothetical protein G4O04_05345 [Anaerolineae bacterium]|nr:hypothetical protein [Anaerolineae bacterium]HID84065.1 hypothetical protein [Anaerolineales bacterium]HIQ09227.1 hypothetical protein [Anaerolineaceae bacterium]
MNASPKTFSPRRCWPGTGLLTLLLLIGVGCTWPGVPSPSPTPTPTTPVPTALPSPTPTLTPSPMIPSPTTPCLAARLVGEPPTYQVVAGGEQTVRWQVENMGACFWSPPLTLQPLGGNPFAPGEVALDGPVTPGKRITLEISLTAPEEPGDYTARWQVDTASGESLPLTLTARLQVLTPTATPGLPVFRQGQVTLGPGNSINFDHGSVEAQFSVTGFGHVGGKVYFYGPLYFWPPDFADCYHAPYTNKNAITDIQAVLGRSFCYTTNEGRVGAFHLDAYYIGDDGQPRLVLTFITWAAKRKK